jgi:uncharacterized protein YdeI (YjbR/CyaY-like superfamily)
MTLSTKVDDFISKQTAWLNELEFIRQILMDTALTEDLKWGMPAYLLQGKIVISMGAFKNHISVWFTQGALLEDKAQKLINAQEGKTKAMRHWKFASLAELKKERKELKAYIHEAIKNAEQGKVVKVERNTTVMMIPAEVKDFLEKEKGLKTAFAALTTGKKKEYYEYISVAKLPATKNRRLEKMKVLVLAGKGLNDQYR